MEWSIFGDFFYPNKKTINNKIRNRICRIRCMQLVRINGWTTDSTMTLPIIWKVSTHWRRARVLFKLMTGHWRQTLPKIWKVPSFWERTRVLLNQRGASFLVTGALSRIICKWMQGLTVLLIGDPNRYIFHSSSVKYYFSIQFRFSVQLRMRISTS
jgi:hypothetical protein